MSLPNEVRTKITDWYKSLQQLIPNFISRAPQREMIAQVAKCLYGKDGRHLVIEAPTGVGKTLSYLLPGIAVCQHEQKVLVISTANIALQDQIFNKDLPLIHKIVPELKYVIAFGRARYVCPRNLSYLASKNDSQTGFLDLYDDDEFSVNQTESEQCFKLYDNLAKNQWDGVRDHHSETISDSLWQKMSTDKQNCLGRNCFHYRECPFFLARRDIESADVIVTNHALVLAALESESLLPAPDKMLLVLDEGHHIPDVARDSQEVHAEISLFQMLNQFDGFSKLIKQATALFDPPDKPALLKNLEQFDSQIELAKELCDHLTIIADSFLPAENESKGQDRYSDRNEVTHIFELGKLTEEFTLLCDALQQSCSKFAGIADFFLEYFNDQTAKHDISKIQKFQLQFSRYFGYFDNLNKLWQLACKEASSQAPISKWLSRSFNGSVMYTYFHCAALRVSDALTRIIWNQVPHVVITSATLRSLNSFSRLEELTGLRPDLNDNFIALASPFTHHEQGRILIPKMKNSPAMENEEAHLNEMARFFIHQFEQTDHQAFLVLFNSNRAMSKFIELTQALRLSLLVQGDKPRSRLIELHKSRIDDGEKSVLVGLNSFSEGLDLREQYLTQVHIHKIGFPPITNPVVKTEDAWLRSKNRSPFDLLSLPQASFSLIQQVGRLIRSHDCRGEIIIYDNRLLTKGYGKRLLAALPAFPLIQPEIPK
ncbi:ATP-dependent DNA helicase DinG [Thorsellia anophelis]|uniref:ATP-dependent DNA helicase DinG n=1 Tax=Thorsellia anophelis DSM 18579 TaxID=1123402 RepID=A0A1I0B3S8_9GAMM|nr:ATP-dependent DNA helicase DinG [Thorsellia anophelis]SET01028.1 ATP-dependent DNA helicase DinG [Thorsellia anophelis DSM 18579]